MDDPCGLDAVMPHLEPYIADIDGVIRGGFARLWTYEPAILADFDETAAAKCVHRHTIMLARQRFDPKPRVNFINLKGLEVLDFGGAACVRFKKVNASGRGRNIATSQKRRFDRQLSLPGLPPAAAHIVAGYKPNVAGSEIEKVLIACPMGRTTLWTIQVVLSEARKWIDITPLRFDGTERYRRPHEGGAASGDARR